jgi:hypothetical protein
VLNKTARAAGFLTLLFCSAVLAGGLGGDEKKSGDGLMPKNETVKLNEEAQSGDDAPQVVHASGRVRMVGSGVFPEIVISGESREWFVAKDEQSKLNELQQLFVTVEGVEGYADLKFANGLPAGRRYTLKNIKIINVVQSAGE